MISLTTCSFDLFSFLPETLWSWVRRGILSFSHIFSPLSPLSLSALLGTPSVHRSALGGAFAGISCCSVHKGPMYYYISITPSMKRLFLRVSLCEWSVFDPGFSFVYLIDCFWSISSMWETFHRCLGIPGSLLIIKSKRMNPFVAEGFRKEWEQASCLFTVVASPGTSHIYCLVNHLKSQTAHTPYPNEMTIY